MSARAGCSLSMSNRSDTCDSLHVINLASDVVSIAAILLSRYWLLDASHLFSGMPLCSYTYINFNKLL